jgi:hypothetical protein
MMNFSFRLFLYIIFINIHIYFSILIETYGKKHKYCFYKYIDQTDNINLSYIISGENEEKVSSFLKYKEEILYHQENKSTGEYRADAKETGTYELCFMPHSKDNYYISFEFFTNYEKGLIHEIAKDESLHYMKKELNTVSLIFEEMEKNIKYITDRRNKHTDVINDIVQQIRNISFLKIIVIVLVSIMQVIIIHRFSSGKKTYNYNFSKVTSSLFADNL